jgi:hypothetical protein
MKLRTVFSGYTKYNPDEIRREIIRLSLYTDEIILFSPFQPCWQMRPKFNPIESPDQWLSDTFKSVFYLIYLMPFIHAGVVILVPKASDLDFKLLENFVNLAKARQKKLLENGWKTPADNESLEYEKKHGFEEMTFSLPRDFLKEKLIDLHPGTSEAEADSIVNYMREKNAEKPYMLKKDIEIPESGGQIECYHGGGNLETAMFMAQISNSYLSTNYTQRKEEILMTAKSDDQNWLTVSQAIQNLELNFLNNVEPDFALQIRENERISLMRNFLRKLGHNAESSSSSEKIMELTDELKNAYGESSDEWLKIKRKMINTSVAGAGIGSLVAAGSINPVIPATGFAIAGVGALINEKFERHSFRKTVPMSLFIDLEEKK